MHLFTTFGNESTTVMVELIALFSELKQQQQQQDSIAAHRHISMRQ